VLKLAVAVVAFSVAVVSQQSRAIEASLPDLPKSLFFVVPPAKAPKAQQQLGLVVVLPGGDGSRDFLPWVEQSLLAQAPDDCVGVLVTAVKWRPDQQIIWPTEASKVPDMQYTTSDYVRAVVAAVEKQHAIDPTRRVVVTWSSSGPAMYPLLCATDGPFSRGYVAMSIWPPGLKDLAAAKDRRFFLDQSPEDTTTTFDHVKRAYDALTKAGACVRLSTYGGGHGWHDDPLPRLQEGLRWLLSDEAAPKPAWPEAKKDKPKKAGPVGKNLLNNGNFERDLQGWNVLNNSQRFTAAVVKDEHHEGRRALHLEKTGGMPLDLVTQEVDLPAGSAVQVRIAVKKKGVGNAFVKVWLYDQDGAAVHDNVDLVQLKGDGGWQVHEQTWEQKGAVRAVVQLVMVMGGELWCDDVQLAVAK
jgi:predicted esterase